MRLRRPYSSSHGNALAEYQRQVGTGGMLGLGGLGQSGGNMSPQQVAVYNAYIGSDPIDPKDLLMPVLLIGVIAYFALSGK